MFKEFLERRIAHLKHLGESDISLAYSEDKGRMFLVFDSSKLIVKQMLLLDNDKDLLYRLILEKIFNELYFNSK